MHPSKRAWISSPRRSAASILERTHVHGAKTVERLQAQIAESVTSPNKHYGVITGAPGIGKSHLLAMAVARARRRFDESELAVAWLPDDPGGLVSELHLFEAIVGALTGPPGGPTGGATGETNGDATTGAAPATADRGGALPAALERIRDVLGGRVLLLCIEDLDHVLATLGDRGQRALRGFLQEERCCVVLGTALAMTEDFTDQARPFFGFFGVHRLEPISVAATQKLLAAHARVRGDTESAEVLAKAAARPLVSALHHMLGGIPARFVDLVRSAAELRDPEALLFRALDEHERSSRVVRERLSTQQRLIFHWLSGQRAAAQVKHVARACYISEQTVSPQLRFLRDAGLVSATRVGREAWYEVSDPLTQMDVDYAVELFAFLRSWFADRDAALAGKSAIASRVREGFERSGSTDPRLLLGMPVLERRLAAASEPAQSPD